MDVNVGSDTIPFLELDGAFRYASVLHWHVELFTIGSSRMDARNTYEKAFQAMYFSGCARRSRGLSKLSGIKQGRTTPRPWFKLLTCCSDILESFTLFQGERVGVRGRGVSSKSGGKGHGGREAGKGGGKGGTHHRANIFIANEDAWGILVSLQCAHGFYSVRMCYQFC